MTVGAPARGLYGGRAFARNVTPAACTGPDGTQAHTIEDGETLVCEGVVLEPINSTVDNLNRARLQTGQAADIYVEKLEQSLGYVELGAVFDQALTDRIGAFGRLAGVQYFGDTETAFVSNFIGAPAGTQAFRTIGDTVQQQVEVDAYLSIALPTDFELSAGGFAEAGDLEAQGARITLKKTF